MWENVPRQATVILRVKYIYPLRPVLGMPYVTPITSESTPAIARGVSITKQESLNLIMHCFGRMYASFHENKGCIVAGCITFLAAQTRWPLLFSPLPNAGMSPGGGTLNLPYIGTRAYTVRMIAYVQLRCYGANFSSLYMT